MDRFRAFVSIGDLDRAALPTPEALSIACPIESPQRQGHPGALALRASLVTAGLRPGRFDATSCRDEPRSDIPVAPTLQPVGNEARRKGPRGVAPANSLSRCRFSCLAEYRAAAPRLSRPRAAPTPPAPLRERAPLAKRAFCGLDFSPTSPGRATVYMRGVGMKPNPQCWQRVISLVDSPSPLPSVPHGREARRARAEGRPSLSGPFSRQKTEKAGTKSQCNFPK